MTVSVGIDIGGSAVKLGLVGPDGLLAGGEPFPLQRDMAFDVFANVVGAAVAALVHRSAQPVAAIGISAPGLADRTGRLVEGGRNVPPLLGGSLPAALSRRFGVPSCMVNDGVCAAQGEVSFGSWSHYQRYAVATLGTGIGGAVVIGGRIVMGPDGAPPEFGAISLDPSRPDTYGPVPGRLDRLGSATALLRRYQELGGDENATVRGIVAQAASAGDAAAMQALDETTRWLAQAFGIMVNILNLEAIVVGGGLAEAGPLVLDRIRFHMTAFVWPSATRTPAIVPAANGNAAGLLGAATFALQRAGETAA